jgi:hypothetical protein
MDNETLEAFTQLSKSFIKDNWKKSLDAMFVLLRKKFVFDNLVIYILEKNNQTPEVVYAKAAGRGRNKEAESSWGEEIANQVISSGKAVESTPVQQPSADRISMHQKRWRCHH